MKECNEYGMYNLVTQAAATWRVQALHGRTGRKERVGGLESESGVTKVKG